MDETKLPECETCREVLRGQCPELSAEFRARFLTKCVLWLQAHDFLWLAWRLTHVVIRSATDRYSCGGCDKVFRRLKTNRPPWPGATPICPPCKARIMAPGGRDGAK